MEATVKSFELKLYEYLFSMQMNTEIKINKICKSENTDRFISTVKEFIDDDLFPFTVEFSSDYSTLKKRRHFTDNNGWLTLEAGAKKICP